MIIIMVPLWKGTSKRRPRPLSFLGFWPFRCFFPRRETNRGTCARRRRRFHWSKSCFRRSRRIRGRLLTCSFGRWQTFFPWEGPGGSWCRRRKSRTIWVRHPASAASSCRGLSRGREPSERRLSGRKSWSNSIPRSSNPWTLDSNVLGWSF